MDPKKKASLWFANTPSEAARDNMLSAFYRDPNERPGRGMAGFFGFRRPSFGPMDAQPSRRKLIEDDRVKLFLLGWREQVFFFQNVFDHFALQFPLVV